MPEIPSQGIPFCSCSNLIAFFIRRSSVYGKTSLTNLNGSQPAYGKDPRPIRDKTFQANCTRNLVEFLMRVGYPHPISQKLLTAPSAKDFQQIFKFLYSNLDPTFEFGKKFEEEVPGLLKGLRYPFANEISKSQLYAVGSMHAWPGLLAMLNWMVELIQCCDELNNSLNNQADDMMVIDAQVGQTDPSARHTKFSLPEAIISMQ
jgi:kinetochore protein NDC80